MQNNLYYTLESVSKLLFMFIYTNQSNNSNNGATNDMNLGRSYMFVRPIAVRSWLSLFFQ